MLSTKYTYDVFSLQNCQLCKIALIFVKHSKYRTFCLSPVVQYYYVRWFPLILLNSRECDYSFG